MKITRGTQWGSQLKKTGKYYFLMVYIIMIICLLGRLGNIGLGYFSLFFFGLFFFAIFAVSGVNSFLRMQVKNRLRKNRFRSAEGIYGFTLFFCIFINSIIALILFFFGNRLSVLLLYDNNFGIFLQAIGLLLPFISVLEVMRGFFSGMGLKRPVSISIILQNIIVLPSSFFFSSGLFHYGEKVSKLLRNENIACMYAALGLVFGIFVAVLSAIAVLFFFSLMLKEEWKGNRRKDIYGKSEHVRNHLAVLLKDGIQRLIFGISTYAFPFIGAIVLLRNTKDISQFGNYVGKGFLFLILLNAIFSIVFENSFNESEYLYRQEQYDGGRRRILGGMRGMFLLVLPIYVFFIVMSDTFSMLFFHSKESMTAVIMILWSLLSLFLCFRFFFSRILGMFREHTVAILLSVPGFLVTVINGIVFVQIFSLRYIGVLLAAVIGQVLSLILYFIPVNRKMRLPLGIWKKPVMNLIISFSSGLLTLIIYLILNKWITAVPALLLICFPIYLLGIVAALFFIRIYSLDDLRYLPGYTLASKLIQRFWKE